MLERTPGYQREHSVSLSTPAQSKKKEPFFSDQFFFLLKSRCRFLPKVAKSEATHGFLSFLNEKRLQSASNQFLIGVNKFEDSKAS